MKLLVVEDEPVTAAFLKRGLQQAQFVVDVAADADAADEAITLFQYDAIVLDVVLPGGDGFELCRRWRAAGVTSPILFLTGRRETTDRVLGLNIEIIESRIRPSGIPEGRAAGGSRRR